MRLIMCYFIITIICVLALSLINQHFYKKYNNILNSIIPRNYVEDISHSIELKIKCYDVVCKISLFLIGIVMGAYIC